MSTTKYICEDCFNKLGLKPKENFRWLFVGICKLCDEEKEKVADAKEIYLNADH